MLSQWEKICATLGIEFIHPCRDSKSVVPGGLPPPTRLSPESMHAAIIADAFRVPWVPVALSREVSPFKWVDWTSSVNVSYSPVCLPPSNRIEYMRNSLLKWTVHSNAPDYPSPSLVARESDCTSTIWYLLMSSFEQVGRRINQRWRWNASIGLEVILKRLARISLGCGERMSAAAALHLDKLRSSDGFLVPINLTGAPWTTPWAAWKEIKSDLRRRAFA